MSFNNNINNNTFGSSSYYQDFLDNNDDKIKKNVKAWLDHFKKFTSEIQHLQLFIGFLDHLNHLIKKDSESGSSDDNKLENVREFLKNNQELPSAYLKNLVTDLDQILLNPLMKTLLCNELQTLLENLEKNNPVLSPHKQQEHLNSKDNSTPASRTQAAHSTTAIHNIAVKLKPLVTRDLSKELLKANSNFGNILDLLKTHLDYSALKQIFDFPITIPSSLGSLKNPLQEFKYINFLIKKVVLLNISKFQNDKKIFHKLNTALSTCSEMIGIIESFEVLNEESKKRILGNSKNELSLSSLNFFHAAADIRVEKTPVISDGWNIPSITLSDLGMKYTLDELLMIHVDSMITLLTPYNSIDQEEIFETKTFIIENNRNVLSDNSLFGQNLIKTVEFILRNIKSNILIKKNTSANPAVLKQINLVENELNRFISTLEMFSDGSFNELTASTTHLTNKFIKWWDKDSVLHHRNLPTMNTINTFLTSFSQGESDSISMLQEILKDFNLIIEIDSVDQKNLIMKILTIDNSNISIKNRVKVFIDIINQWKEYKIKNHEYGHILQFENKDSVNSISHIRVDFICELKNQNNEIYNEVLILMLDFYKEIVTSKLKSECINQNKNPIFEVLVMFVYMNNLIVSNTVNASNKIPNPLLLRSIFVFIYSYDLPAVEEWNSLKNAFMWLFKITELIGQECVSQNSPLRNNPKLGVFFDEFIKMMTDTFSSSFIDNIYTNDVGSILNKFSDYSFNALFKRIQISYLKTDVISKEDIVKDILNLYHQSLYNEPTQQDRFTSALCAFSTQFDANQLCVNMHKLIEKQSNLKIFNNSDLLEIKTLLDTIITIFNIKEHSPVINTVSKFLSLILLNKFKEISLLINPRTNIDLKLSEKLTVFTPLLNLKPVTDENSKVKVKSDLEMNSCTYAMIPGAIQDLLSSDSLDDKEMLTVDKNLLSTDSEMSTSSNKERNVVTASSSASMLKKSNARYVNLILQIHATWRDSGVSDRLRYLLKLAKGKNQFDLSKLNDGSTIDLKLIKKLLKPFHDIYLKKSIDLTEKSKIINYSLKICRYCTAATRNESVVFKESLEKIYPNDLDFVELMVEALSKNSITTTLKPTDLHENFNAGEGVFKAFMYFTLFDMKYHIDNLKEVLEINSSMDSSATETLKYGVYFFCKDNGEIHLVPLLFSLNDSSKIQAYSQDTEGTVRKFIVQKLNLLEISGPLILPKNKIELFNNFCIGEKSNFITLTEISNSSIAAVLVPSELQDPEDLPTARKSTVKKTSENNKRLYEEAEITNENNNDTLSNKINKKKNKINHVAKKILDKPSNEENPMKKGLSGSIASQSFKGFGIHGASSIKSAGSNKKQAEDPTDMDQDNDDVDSANETSAKKRKPSNALGYTHYSNNRHVPEKSEAQKASPELEGQKIALLPHNPLLGIDLGKGVNPYATLLLKTQAYALNKLQNYSHLLKFDKPETLLALTSSISKALHHLGVIQPLTPQFMYDTKLKPYQRETVERCLSLFSNSLGAVIASHPGMGKTRQAIEICLQVLAADAQGKPCLIVAPKAIVSQWMNEAVRRLFKSRRENYERFILNGTTLTEPQKVEFTDSLVRFFVQFTTVEDGNETNKKRKTYVSQLLTKALKSSVFSSLVLKSLIEYENKYSFRTNESKKRVLDSLSTCFEEFIKNCKDHFHLSEVLKHPNFDSFVEQMKIPHQSIQKRARGLAFLILYQTINAKMHINAVTTYIKNLEPLYHLPDNTLTPHPWNPALIVPDLIEQVVIISTGTTFNEVELKKRLGENRWAFVIINKESLLMERGDHNVKSLSKKTAQTNSLTSAELPEDVGVSDSRYQLIKSIPFSLIIWDEAQEIAREYSAKDTTKVISNKALEFTRHCSSTHQSKLIAMSGTPMPNNYNQTLSLIEFVNPKHKISEMVKKLSELEGSAKKHLKEWMKNLSRPSGETINSIFRAYLAYEHFKFLHKNLVFVHSKDDPSIIQQWTVQEENMETHTNESVCYIPTKISTVISYTLPADLSLKLEEDFPKLQHNPILYKAPFEIGLIHQEFLTNGKVLSDSEFESKVKSICTNLETLESFIHGSALLNRFLNGEEFNEIIKNKTPCLIFLNNVQPAEALKQIITKKFKLDESYVNSYHGSKTNAQREDVKTLFEKNGGILILTGKAGGVGLNLKKAKAVFNLAPWWNDAYTIQLEARSLRAGVRGTVNIYSFTGNSIAEKYYKSIQERKKSWCQWIFNKNDYESFVKLLIDDIAAEFNPDSLPDLEELFKQTLLESQVILDSEDFQKQLDLFRSFYPFQKEKSKKFFNEDDFLLFPGLTFSEGPRHGGREKAYLLGVNLVSGLKDHASKNLMNQCIKQCTDASIREMIRVGDWAGLEQRKFSKTQTQFLSQLKDGVGVNVSITNFTHELYEFTNEKKYCHLKTRVGGDQKVRVLKRVISDKAIKYDLLFEKSFLRGNNSSQ